MNDGYPEVGAALDAIPLAEPKPVDIATIYRSALDRQASTARRWKRIAVAVSALAAGIVLLALLPKLELRCNADEFAVRWGAPPTEQPSVAAPSEPKPDPRMPDLIDEQSFHLHRDGFRHALPSHDDWHWRIHLPLLRL